MASPAENLLIQTSLQIQSALEAILFSTTCIGGTLMTPVPMNITLPSTNITVMPDTPINGTNFPLGGTSSGNNGNNGDNGVTNTAISSNNTTTPDSSNVGGVDLTSATLLPEGLPYPTADSGNNNVGGVDLTSATLLPVLLPSSTAGSAAAVTSVAAYPYRLA